MGKNIKILTFTTYYLPGYKGGGPIKTINNLINQTSDSLLYKVVTLDRDLGDTCSYNSVKLNSWNDLGNSKIYYTQPGLKGIKQIFKLLAKENYDIVYLNSFFSPRFSLLPLLLCKLLNQQVILGPRGEFSKGALKLKPIKKKLFIKTYKLLKLSRGIIFQASSEHEAKDIKRVLGSGVDIVIAEDIGSQDFTTNISYYNKTTMAVFISRISPMKNLDLALKALKKVKGSLIYDIYGPIEDELYWQECLNIIADLPSNITVQYKGELKPNQVIDKLALYDFFFMPTKGENFGHVIAEALCAGLPLVISNATPWRDLESLGIGWDLPLNNLNMFSEIIDKLIEMPDEQHYKMRQTVLSWAKKKFAQYDTIEANIAMFRYAYNKKGINNDI